MRSPSERARPTEETTGDLAPRIIPHLAPLCRTDRATVSLPLHLSIGRRYAVRHSVLQGERGTGPSRALPRRKGLCSPFRTIPASGATFRSPPVVMPLHTSRSSEPHCLLRRGKSAARLSQTVHRSTSACAWGTGIGGGGHDNVLSSGVRVPLRAQGRRPWRGWCRRPAPALLPGCRAERLHKRLRHKPGCRAERQRNTPGCRAERLHAECQHKQPGRRAPPPRTCRLTGAPAIC